MNFLLGEPRISLSALAHRENVHLSTCWRWCLKGCKGYVLESFAIGGKRFTTQPAYERWLVKINGATATGSATPRQRERAIEYAERELDEILGSI